METRYRLLTAELKEDPYDVSKWWTYLDTLESNGAGFRLICSVFEAAVKHVPGSYKLWYRYLEVRRKRARGLRIDDPRYTKANHTYERCLVFLSKMPRIWLDYLEFLLAQSQMHMFRTVVDEAIKSLPISQHDRIWEFVLTKIWKQRNCVSIGIPLYERFLKLQPSKREEYIDYLMLHEKYSETCLQLYYLLKDKSFLSVKKKSKHDYWVLLCDLIRERAAFIHQAHHHRKVDVEKIIRVGLKKYTDQSGKLWCCLADYYIKLGKFDRALNIYYEAMEVVVTVRDFSTVFDACAQFQETLLSAKIELYGDSAQEQAPPNGNMDMELALLEGDNDINDVDMLLARLEYLLECRPLLLNKVMLRQNPNNVIEWRKQVQLCLETMTDSNRPEIVEKVIRIYREGIAVLDYTRPFVGRATSLLIDLALFYETHNRLQDSWNLFQEGLKIEFPAGEDMVEVVGEYCEMLIRSNKLNRARTLLQECFEKRKSSRKRIEDSQLRRQAKLRGEGGVADAKDDEKAVPKEVVFSTKLWALYVDLEISLGTIKTVRAVYDKMLQMKVMTPVTILHYAYFLEEQDLFEEAFTVYEKGVSLFSWPESSDIWVLYLDKFEQRYGGYKLDRGRELYEEALVDCPHDMLKTILLMYAHYEEAYGFTSHCMQIYEKFSKQLPLEDRFDVFLIYLRKTLKYYGLLKARSVYEAAIQNAYESIPVKLKHLDNTKGYDLVSKLCVYYAHMEKQVGEIERSRAIFQYGSQFSNPQSTGFFWDAWYQLELEHGNATTFKEMLRVKRSITVQFGSQTGALTALESPMEESPPEEALVPKKRPEIEDQPPVPTKKPRVATGSKKEEDAHLEIDVEEVLVPNAVFGGLK